MMKHEQIIPILQLTEYKEVDAKKGELDLTRKHKHSGLGWSMRTLQHSVTMLHLILVCEGYEFRKSGRIFSNLKL